MWLHQESASLRKDSVHNKLAWNHINILLGLCGIRVKKDTRICTIDICIMDNI